MKRLPFLFLTFALAAFPQERERIQMTAGWTFQIDPQKLGEKEGWYGPAFNRSAWRGVNVPEAWDRFETALRGYEGVGWYAVILPGSLARSGKRQRIEFGRVNYHTKAWLNGEPLGENVNGYLPFSFDVTGKLRADGANLLVLRVDNRARVEWLPGASEIEWVQYGGILAPVYLEAVSPIEIADVTVTAAPQGPGASIRVRAEIHNATEQQQEVVLRAEISGRTSKELPLQLAPGSTSVHDVELSLDRATPWSPDSPVLYTLSAALVKSGAAVDRLRAEFGVRTIAVRGREILLNGKPILVKGVNRYDEYGQYGPNPPRELLLRELQMMKAAGINFVRVHYPQSPEVLSLYDRMGFFFMEEVPINWWAASPTAKQPEPQDDHILTQAMPALDRMIRRDKNHPSLIIWSMANESRTETETGARVMRALIRRTRELDPTRLVTFVIGGGDTTHHAAYEEADLRCVNVYLGQFGQNTAAHFDEMNAKVTQPSEAYLRRQLELAPGKPILVTEFGTRAIRGMHGDAPYTEEFQAHFIEAAWKAIRDCPEVSGGVLWCWADYYHRREFIQYADFGPYGVVNIDRQPKAALRALTKMYNAR